MAAVKGAAVAASPFLASCGGGVMNPTDHFRRRPASFLRTAACLLLAGIIPTTALAWDHYAILTDPDQIYGPGEAVQVSGKLVVMSARDPNCDGTSWTPDPMAIATADVLVVPDTGQPYPCAYPIRERAVARLTVQVTMLDGFLFNNRTVGWTAPTGAIPPGCYDLFIDECQDGKYSPGRDFVLGDGAPAAFRVEPFADRCPCLASQAPFKAAAGDMAQEMLDVRRRVDTGFTILNSGRTAASVATSILSHDFLLAGVHLAQTVWGQTCLQLESECHCVTPATPLTHGQQMKQTALGLWDVSVGQSQAAYAAIAADPPVYGARIPAGIGSHVVHAARTNDAVEKTLIAMSNYESRRGAFAQGALGSFERYAGALAGSDNRARLLHARQLHRCLTALQDMADSLRITTVSLRMMMASSHDDARWDADLVRDFQSRLAQNGIDPALRYAMLRCGLTSAEIDSAVAAYTAIDYSALESDSLSGKLTAYEQALSRTDEMEATVSELAEVITLLEGCVSVALPRANAGGPYAGLEGQPVALSGIGTSPDPVTEYAWDLDGDAVFDDLSSPSGTVTFTHEGVYLISLRIADGTGWGDIDVTTVTIGNQNDPPRILATHPSEAQVVPRPAGVLLLSVVVEDTDNDPLQFTWYADDAVLDEDGPSLAVDLASLSPGLHRYLVEVIDGWSGHETTWHWLVLRPDLRVEVESIASPASPAPGLLPPVLLEPGFSCTRTLTVVNTSVSARNVAVSIQGSYGEAIPWAAASVDSFGLAGGDSGQVDLAFSAVGLSTSTYAAKLILEADDDLHTQVVMPLGLSVGGVTGAPEDGPENPRRPAIRTLSGNPSQGAFRFALSLPQPARVRASVYDVSGRVVRTLLDEQCQNGEQMIAWDGRDRGGRPVASGVYLLRALVETAPLHSRFMVVR